MRPSAVRLASDGCRRQVPLGDGQHAVDLIDQGAQVKRLGEELGVGLLRGVIIERDRGEAGDEYDFRISRFDADAARQDAIFQGLVPALDLALGLGMIGNSTDMPHSVVYEPVCKITRDVRRAIVTEQPGFMDDLRLVAASCFQRHVLPPYN